VLSLSRELEEINEKVEELERGKRMLQSELDELANTQGTADKNVSPLYYLQFLALILMICFFSLHFLSFLDCKHEHKNN
jgi:hypothetical protein